MVLGKSRILLPRGSFVVEIPNVLAVCHIWEDKLNGSRAVHDFLKNPRAHVSGRLHGPLLCLPRGAMSFILKIAKEK